MYGYISGCTNTDDVSSCPRCGDEIRTVYNDGTIFCDGCGFRFGVVEYENEVTDEENLESRR